jgi:superkiller protein 3
VAATDSYNNGLAALKGGNLVSAAEHFTKVLTLTPDDAQAQMLLGYVRLKQERYDEAVEALQAADTKGAKLDVRSRAIIQNNIGMAYWNQKQYSRALPAYQKAVALDGGYTDARYNLAFALLSQNRAKEALPLFTALAAQNPRDPMLQDGLGQSHEALSDWAKAFAAYKRAIALNAKDSSYPLNLGLAMLRSDPNGTIPGRRDQAIGFLREATKLNPQGAPAFLQLGLLLIEKKRWPEAQDTLRRYVALKPEDFLGIFNLALAHDYAGKFDDALKLYGQAETMMPTDPAVKNNVGRIYLKRKLYNESIEQFQKALALDATFADARNNLALALAAKGDYATSNSEWRKLITATSAEIGRTKGKERLDLQGRLASARAALAENYLRDKNYAEAATEYRALVKSAPNNGAAWSNLGLALYHTKDLAGALAAYDDLLKRDPKNAVAHNNRGVVLEAQNKKSDALVAFKRAVELKPDYTEAKANRDRLLAATVVS